MKKFLGITVGVLSTLAFSLTAFAGAWQQTGAGWTYLKDNQQYANNEFVVDNGHLYFIGPDYQMKTGFVPINHQYYYFGAAGDMNTGWIYDNNNWYYVSPETGTMISNMDFTDSNGKQYHFNPDGTMAHDTIINGYSYGSDGALMTNNPYNRVPMTAPTQNMGNSSALQLVTNRYTSSGSSNSDSYYDDDDDDYSSSNSSGSHSSNSSSGNYDYDEYANEILRLVNKERKKYNRSALTLDSDLCDYANMRAEQIVDDFSHDGFDEDGELEDIAGNTWLGENIAMGQTSPASVMTAWNKSSGHHKNIISKNYARLGVGVHYENGKYYWVQIFAGND